MWIEAGLGSYSGRLWEAFSSYPSGPLTQQERLLSVGTDGGGYINLCTNKDDLSLSSFGSLPLPTYASAGSTAAVR
jgi:hypothetical protein